MNSIPFLVARRRVLSALEELTDATEELLDVLAATFEEPGRKQARLDDLLTITDATRHLGVSEGKLRTWRKEETGPHWVKVAGQIRYRVSDLDAWIEDEIARGEQGPAT